MPRRKWGQHFLRDAATARRLVSAAGVLPGETILEIGPGTGRLTRALLEVAARVVAIEIDPGLAERLPGELEEPGRVTIVHADAAKADLAALLAEHRGPDGRARVVANLPYESATPILTRLLQLGDRVDGIAVLVQREVAERVVSPPGRKEYGYLSVLCQDVAEAWIVARLPPGAFRPPPKVHSALVRLELRQRPLRGDLDGERFRSLVGRLFEQRRKTVLNNLQAAAGLKRAAAEALLLGAGIDPGHRPERLDVTQLARIVRALEDTGGT